jgi:hypothetical protein
MVPAAALTGPPELIKVILRYTPRCRHKSGAPEARRMTQGQIKSNLVRFKIGVR